MPPKPKVPFELHPAARLLSNTEVAHGVDLALLPDGSVAVLRGDWNSRQIDLHPAGGGAVETLLAPDPSRLIAHFAWSDDGRRWAGVAGRDAGDKRLGDVYVGERGREELLCVAALEEYGSVTRNALPRAASTVTFSPDGATVVVRVSPGERRDHLVEVDVATGEARLLPIPRLKTYLYAHAFDPDGTLFAVTADPGLSGGLWWFPPGVRDRAGQSPSPTGFALIPAPRGLWVVGAPTRAFRLGKGVPARATTDSAARVERAELLRARASVKWDQRYLDYVVQSARRDDAPREAHVEPHAAPGETLRTFEHELFWETAYAALIGEDDVVISDGLAVFLWREGEAGVTRTRLVEDVARCTHRAARIVGLAARGDAFAVLWKKDAVGAKTVLSRFALDRGALDP